MSAAVDLRSLSAEDLSKKILENREEMLRLRFQEAKGVLENPIRLRALRREIARVQTVQRERQLGIR